jgi:ribokinase
LRQALLHALSIAYDYEVPIYFDPSPIINRIPKRDLWKTISTSKVMLLNERELRIITETSDLDEGIRTLLNSGPHIIVIKQGEKGCLLCNQSRSEQVPSFSVKVVDTTGAGDSFNAAFIFGQLKEWSMRETALFANAVGAIKVTKLGAGTQVPTKAEVNHFLTKHKIDVKAYCN